ncbi:MAG: CD3324 family protein [Solidesulfovibrio sp. DCME]|uniref:CD3324 family protein n=1 Tax=Solidesulfovibrio sp. DCME TaxID=3447380 RepID=UPI003D0CC6D8
MMAYTKAAAVLPSSLIEAIQRHVDGICLYVPRKAGGRKGWGEKNNSRELLRRRNAAICEQYRSGVAVAAIAAAHCLSPKTVYKILASQPAR